MADSVPQSQVAAGRAYEALHVPALFAPWTERVLDAVRIGSGARVLDVACGTGILARAAAARIGPSGFVAGVDSHPGMLVVAGERAPAIEWRLGSAESLPYEDRTFDTVLSQFGLMFFTNRRLALQEMVRVLVPGGNLAVAVWDGLNRSPGYAAEVELLERLAGPDAADALRAPFALGDATAVLSLLESAGVGSPAITTLDGTARFPSIRAMVEADLRGWLPAMGVVLEESRIQRILAEAETALAPFRTPRGDVVFDTPAHIATGTRS